MADHLPECPPWVVITGSEADCICDRLRACEARYEAERRPIDVRATQLAVQHGFEQGVQAARDAVAALPQEERSFGAVSIDRDAALAAIDALRGDA